MKKILLRTNIKREKKLYFCGTDDNGCLTVCSAERNEKKKENKESKNNGSKK